jgi:peroxiredoxin Q/BCP
LIDTYGVWGEKTLFGRTYMGIRRTTFLINKAGVIEHVIEKVSAKDHAAQILKTWGL